MADNNNQATNQPVGQAPANQTSTNGFAIASLIMGLIPGLNILAIIFGFVALSQIKATGQGGKGMAIAGLVLGFASLIIVTIIILWSVIFVSAVTNDVIRSAPVEELDTLFNQVNGLDGSFNITTP